MSDVDHADGVRYGFCSRDEYVLDAAGEVLEQGDLHPDDHYTVAFALRNTWRHRKEAVRLLSWVNTVSPVELSPAFYEVEFIVFDTSIRPTVRERAMFKDGFLQADSARPNLRVNGELVIGGFFMQYEPEQELQAIASGATLEPAAAFAA